MTSRFSPILLCRLVLLLLTFLSCKQWRQEKSPAESSLAKHVAAGHEPTLKDCIKLGQWYGGAARTGALLLLVGLSFGWSRGDSQGQHCPKLKLTGELAATVSSRGFWLSLAAILVVALAMRLPRMAHSYWLDESDAIATYVQGTFKPVDPTNPQGALVFDQPSWDETLFSAIHGPNNHVLFSILSRSGLDLWRWVNHLPVSAFAEWVTRVPSLVGGLVSILGIALLLRRWAAPLLGLFSAGIMAWHPWHLRYSTEARGYGMTLGMMPFYLIAITSALESNRWRHWLAMGALELAMLYSWAGVAYALLPLHLGLAVMILRRRDWRCLGARWLAAHAIAAAIFISLYAPLVPQIALTAKSSAWVLGGPMDAAWLHNVLVSPFTGVVFHCRDPSSLVELSWQSLYAASPVITVVGFALLLVCFVIGSLAFWKRQGTFAWLLGSAFIGAALGMLHFKYGLKAELRPWYLIYLLPSVCVFMAAGLLSLSSNIRRALAQRLFVVSLIIVMALCLWPALWSSMTHAEQDYRAATAVSRGRHEVFDPSGSSRVLTSWLRCVSPLYDPRCETHIRDLDALQKAMQKQRATGGEFYLIAARYRAGLWDPEMMAVAHDPSQFEPVAMFDSREAEHQIEVWRMKSAP